MKGLMYFVSSTGCCNNVWWLSIYRGDVKVFEKLEMATLLLLLD